MHKLVRRHTTAAQETQAVVTFGHRVRLFTFAGGTTRPIAQHVPSYQTVNVVDTVVDTVVVIVKCNHIVIIVGDGAVCTAVSAITVGIEMIAIVIQ